MRNRNIPSQAPFGMRVQTVEVVSESDPDVTYRVTLPHCECKSFRFPKPDQKRLWCKHLDAATESGLGDWQTPDVLTVASG